MEIFKKNNIVLIIQLVLFTFLLAFPVQLYATDTIFNQTSKGVINAGTKIYGGTTPPTQSFEGTLLVILSSLLNLLAIIFFLLLIYAGYLWMNARGKEEQIEKAKKITREALIGLIIIILARILTEFILTQIGKAAF